jgi:tyrosinase
MRVAKRTSPKWSRTSALFFLLEWGLNITLRSVLNRAHSKTTQDCIALLSRVRDWDGFSNHSSSENSLTNSLESIHDNIHSQVGGNGHMGDPAVAGKLHSPCLTLSLSAILAFDPIFYLHHCNVDRMITLWAALNPGVWVSPGAGPDEGTFNIQPGSEVDTNTG